MIGDVKSSATIICTISSSTILADLRVGNTATADICVGKVNIVHGYPEYYGPYSVTPTGEDQILETSLKTTIEDITVKAIPYTEIENEYGGLTAIIGAGG